MKRERERERERKRERKREKEIKTIMRDFCVIRVHDACCVTKATADHAEKKRKRYRDRIAYGFNRKNVSKNSYEIRNVAEELLKSFFRKIMWTFVYIDV